MNPIKYEGADLQFVDAFSAKPSEEKTGGYWSDAAATSLRASIKKHYIKAQNNRCCYCKQLVMQNNHDVWDAEHIIPRDTHPQFVFEPLNLAISCGPCNEAKGKKNVLVNAKRKTFPGKSADYIIVHPHFDDYDEHILWFGLVPAPNGSKKGQKTIEMCELLRFAAEYGSFNSDLLGSAFREGLGKLMLTRDQTDAQAVSAALDVHIKKLPG
ncbi:hypothetical protein [Rhizobium leguminosarum]|uniref:HNH endonuclease n=1 Tax=Rhizobium leguminosarum TaxID=384 RepID=UPI002FEF6170